MVQLYKKNIHEKITNRSSKKSILAKVYVKLGIILELYFVLSCQEKYTIFIEFYIRNTDKISNQNHLLNNNNKSNHLSQEFC